MQPDLGEDVVHDVAVDIGQSEIATLVSIGEFLVIETQRM